MVKTDRDLDQKESLSRLQLLMFLRVGFVSLLLGVAIVIQVRETKTYFGEILNAHYFLIALIYFLTFIYIVALKYIKNLFKFAYLQLLIDTIFITAIIYTTGGIESIFSFLYLLNIISGGIILYRYGGMIIASFSSILYGAFLDLSYYGLINPISYRFPYIQEYQRSEIFYMILVNVAAFYLVAFLSGFLSEQIQKSRAEVKAKQKDIVDLEMLKENIIQNISSGLVALDERNKIIVFNRGAEVIFKIDSKNAIHKDISDIIPHIMPYLKIHSPHKFSQLSYKGKEGQQIDLLLNISPLKEYDGSNKGKILVFQDTTRIREMEQEVKRMEDMAMLGELAAGIAHEIRNPLASISGSIQVLNDSLSKEETHINRRLIEIVLREVSRLDHLVNDFLQFARPQRIEIEEFELNQLIMDTLYLFQNSQSWSEHLDIDTKIMSPLTIKSDPHQLKQIFWNIFLNASEAMPKGGLISINAQKETNFKSSSESIESVRIKIEDNGPGLDPKIAKEIFKPFSTTKKDGSGLGLAIVKRLVEGLGGKVSGENLASEGTAITIRLPVSIDKKVLTVR
ncbi:MAG: PAS domain-containing protein [Deltaproteobacteria bacterium]|nr:PAS domain-containing protein [Deltaproteobacteria bacterium]